MHELLTELKRRNVFRVGISYTVIAWVIAQAFDLVADNFGAPDWVMKFLLAILLAGLPVALVLAWAFELTPDGVKKTKDVPLSQSVTPNTGRTLNRITTVALILVLAFVAWDKLGPNETTASHASTDKSVAVLPFADLSQSQDQEWFADGLTEEILNALARLPELQVTARTSSFEFKNTNTDIGEIASKLGVAHVVEGSVRRIGDDLRVTAQLIRAADGFHLWSKTYESSTERLFDVQHDVAENIAATLDVILDADKRSRMFATGTRDVAAFEEFMKGRDLFFRAHRRTAIDPVSLADANRHFDLALQLDPAFSRASILHSDRYAHFLIEGESVIVGTGDNLDEQSASAQLQRDFDAAAANAADTTSRLLVEINREFFSAHWHRLPALISQLKDELSNNESLPEDGVWLDEILRVAGEYELAGELATERRLADPLNQAAWMDGVHIELMQNDYAAALALIDEARRNTGDGLRFREGEITIAMLQGDKSRAIELLEKEGDGIDVTDYFPLLIATLRGDSETASRLADAIEGKSNVPNSRLIWPYAEMSDAARMSNLVSRIDKLAIGPSILAIDIASNGGVLMFDLDDTPNFRQRLREAKIDPAAFNTTYQTQ